MDGLRPDLLDSLPPDMREIVARFDERLGVLERRSAPLVVEREQPDGSIEVRAARAGVDWKTIAWVVSVIVMPITVAILTTR